MITTDPIADMLSRIRNAVAVNKQDVVVPHSKLKESVARLLAENNFVGTVSVKGELTTKTITIKLFTDATKPRISEITRLSKPGRRAYVNSTEIPVVRRGRGIVILSTSKGLMTGERARSEKVGGELICSVY